MSRGLLAKAYRNTGNFGTPTFDEVPLFDDLMINDTVNTSPSNSRESTIGSEAPALGAWSITGTVKCKKDDTDYLALQTAQKARTPIDLMFLTGASDSNNEAGYRCEWLIKTWGQDQGTGVGQMYRQVEFVPHGLSTNPKQTVLVSAGAPVFTNT